MKVRIKFAKTGHMKFVGHLDTMRYFQKAVRRAGLPIAFSGGYSPHMIMSFAAPLGVGTTSLGEYFDMELTETVPTKEIENRLNAVMVDGVSVCSARQVEDGKASTAMSLVAAADYSVQFREGKEPAADWRSRLDAFLSQKEIIVTKKTKRSEKTVDIRPYIYEMHLDGEGVFMQLASRAPTIPNRSWSWTLFFSGWVRSLLPFAYMIERREVYANKGMEEDRRLVTLEALGDEVE